MACGGPGRLVRLVVQTQVISGGRSHSPFPGMREGDTSQAGTYITFTKGIDALHFLAEGGRAVLAGFQSPSAQNDPAA